MYTSPIGKERTPTMDRVLIVEDDPQVAQINRGYLEVLGFTVVGTASNAQQALDLLEQQPVDLVMLDIYLPGGNGLDVLRQLRAGSKPIDVIVVSAAKDSMKIREAFRSGCLDYIIKPFTAERLGRALMKYRQKAELLSKEFLGQEEIDLLATQGVHSDELPLPKGIDRHTLDLVCRFLLTTQAAFGVQDLADGIQISRVSAKKYLDYLYSAKAIHQTYIYGKKGRPANLYQVTSSDQPKLRRFTQ